MIWPACGAEPRSGGHASAAQAGATATSDAVAVATGDLEILRGGDGSFSLWSTSFGEGFHSSRGALREARETFVVPSQLDRFAAGRRLRVVEVCVGTGTNLAALLEACTTAGLELEWWGLELDPAPLQLALAEPEFRSQWHPQTLKTLETLSERGCWQQGCWQQGCWQQGAGSGRILWGDARQTLPHLLEQRQGQVDLIWHDAFSPQRCPQLWTVEFLGSLAELLADGGRWISYCSAAAVRETLAQQGLQLAALAVPAGQDEGKAPQGWSGGSLASPAPWPSSPLWRPLTVMEVEHLSSAAGEPYRDPTGIAPAAVILAKRHQAQAAGLAHGARSSSGAWRRKWHPERGPGA